MTDDDYRAAWIELGEEVPLKCSTVQEILRSQGLYGDYNERKAVSVPKVIDENFIYNDDYDYQGLEG